MEAKNEISTILAHVFNSIPLRVIQKQGYNMHRITMYGSDQTNRRLVSPVEAPPHQVTTHRRTEIIQRGG